MRHPRRRIGGSTNRSFIQVQLAPESQRARSQTAIQTAIQTAMQTAMQTDVTKAVASGTGMRAFAVPPISLGIRGGCNGLQFALVGPEDDRLAKAADTVVAALSADPRFGQVRSSCDTAQAQVQARIDRTRAHRHGAEIAGVGTSLQAMLGGKSLGTIALPGGTCPVCLQSTCPPATEPTDLQNIVVRAAHGRDVPRDSVVRISESPAAPNLNRESLRRAIDISAAPTDGFTISDGRTQAVTRLAPQLPEGVPILPLTEAQSIGQNSGGLATTFGFASQVVLLVLAAQFESFVCAAIIMASVPFGPAAVFSLTLTGGALNVGSQIGRVLLVGIMAKNGILATVFANPLRDRGATVRAAIKQASLTRLRPIMLTKIATILGAVPLVLAAGPGAEAPRRNGPGRGRGFGLHRHLDRCS